MSYTPWKVVLDRNNHWGCVEVEGPALRVVGFTIATNVTPEKAEAVKAHAHLIAAAPELLEACKAALTMTGHNHWDSTMQHGAGCELCIHQHKVCEQLESAIAIAERISP